MLDSEIIILLIAILKVAVGSMWEVLCTPGGPQGDETSANLQDVSIPTGGRSGEDCLGWGDVRKPSARYVCQVFLSYKFPWSSNF